MKRLLIRSPSFVRAAKRFVKKRPDNGAELRKALTLLENDVFHPSLKAHKLQGKLTGSWACCVGYDLRIIFRLDRYNEQEAIFSVLFRAFSGQKYFSLTIMNKTLFIAEVSSNYHRDLDRFLQLFDKATSIGCDVVDLSLRWLLKGKEKDVCLIQEK